MPPPGGAAARRWPAVRWGAVARQLRATRLRVVVTGSPEERGLAEEVAAEAGLSSHSVLAGRTGLTTLAALTAEAGLLELTIADVMAAVREVRSLRTGGGFNHDRPGSAKQHGRIPA